MYRLIFRTATDLGHKRMDSTADSKTILDNMDRFLTKWKECELDGWKLINEAALKEADLLTVHINKGCLSNLPIFKSCFSDLSVILDRQCIYFHQIERAQPHLGETHSSLFTL